MRLAEINDSLNHTTEELKEMLPTHCSQALRSSTVLYRGTYSHIHSFLGTIRKDRRPLSSDPLRVAMFDYICEANNWPHRKSNTVSATTSYQQAKFFGGLNGVMRIYPFDGCEYLFSPKVNDFLYITDDVIDMFLNLEPQIREQAYASGDFNATVFQYLNQILDFMKLNMEEITKKSGLVYTKDINLTNDSNGEVLIYGTQFICIKDENYG